jgi:hypothetical protein
MTLQALDTINKSIYLFQQPENNSGAVGNYLVLSENGGAYISCPLCTIPATNVVCDSSKGFFGSYTLEHNTIKVTLFSQWARYYVLYGILSEEGIQFTHRKSKGSLSGRQEIPNRFYRKTNISFNCQFDWMDQ